jgi:hypothetical protein
MNLVCIWIKGKKPLCPEDISPKGRISVRKWVIVAGKNKNIKT